MITKLKKRIQNNRLEITYNLGKKVIGFTSCSYQEMLKQVEIHSLYVDIVYKKHYLMEKLLEEIHSFAKENKAESIKTTLGAEPFSESGQIPMEQEEAFYQQAGFIRTEKVANIPCMLKFL